MQLSRLVQEWSEATDSSNYVAAVFFDIRKAFDQVWHRGLVAKLSAAGVSGSALAWFENFLSQRSQRTVVGRCFSDCALLHAGVPQGAILNPLLFILYMNDVSSTPEASLNLFADNTSLYVTAKVEEQLQIKLSAAVQSLISWFDKWILSVNASKSALMVFRSKGMPVINLSCSVHGSPVSQVSSHKHLGIVFNDLLSWSDHTSYLVKKMSQRIGFLSRLRSILPPLTIRHLYITCIRPLADYSCVAWSGIGKGDAGRLEKVQRRAARLITGLRQSSLTPHNILLARAGLSSLEDRRGNHLALFVFKFIHEQLPFHFSSAFSAWLSSKPARTSCLRNAPSLRLPRPKKSALKSSPLYVGFSFWNSLPAKAKESWASLKGHFSTLQ